MRVVIQRVQNANVSIDGLPKSSINMGMLILVGIENADTDADLDWLCNKIYQLRIFPDEDGVMNKSLRDVNGELLVISQFTLHAKTKKGNRPSYINAAKPDVAIPLYKKFVTKLNEISGKQVQTGEFGANMQVSLVNDGPVTIIIDSKNRE